MEDFGFLSDADESAVDEVISQAQDLCVLEQLSAINCSAFTHSVLPSDLDSRFRRLKSFPVPVNQKTNQIPDKDYISYYKPSDSPHRTDPFTPKRSPSSPVSTSDSFPQNSLFSPSKTQIRSTSNSRSFASPLPLDSSPPKKAGCFWCSPKRLSKKQKKENRVLDPAFDSDEFLSDLATFPVKRQQKMLNKAIKEQDKVCQEAEKIVNWAKQASARMSSHGIEDELSCSDDEPAK
ncbi:hypothetical protein DITRI_Ditri04bG0075600 [Diplodiscus trichospermus]